jgi:hypothetical protein
MVQPLIGEPIVECLRHEIVITDGGLGCACQPSLYRPKRCIAANGDVREPHVVEGHAQRLLRRRQDRGFRVSWLGHLGSTLHATRPRPPLDDPLGYDPELDVLALRRPAEELERPFGVEVRFAGHQYSLGLFDDGA